MSVRKQFLEFFGESDVETIIADLEYIKYDGDSYEVEYYSDGLDCTITMTVAESVMGNTTTFRRYSVSGDGSMSIPSDSSFGRRIHEILISKAIEWRAKETERLRKEEEARTEEKRLDDLYSEMLGGENFTCTLNKRSIY